MIKVLMSRSSSLTGKSEKEDKSEWSDQVWAESAHGHVIGHLVSDVNHGQSINTAAIFDDFTTHSTNHIWTAAIITIIHKKTVSPSKISY